MICCIIDICGDISISIYMYMYMNTYFDKYLMINE